MRTGRPEHLRTFNYRGLHRYFLTFCTFNRLARFTDGARVHVARTQILRACVEQEFALTAYCFMPDHVHLLVEGTTDGSDCLRLIARAKQYSGFYYRRRFGQTLWQRYGYEHTLRSDEQMLSVARYIIENPVRAGLVAHAGDYPYVGSETHGLGAILDAVQVMPTWRRSG